MEEQEMETKIEYVAYCVTCGKEIDRAPNGMMVESAGRLHIKGFWGWESMPVDDERRPHPDHEVIIGMPIR